MFAVLIGVESIVPCVVFWAQGPSFSLALFQHYTGVRHVSWIFDRRRDWPVLCGLIKLYHLVCMVYFLPLNSCSYFLYFPLFQSHYLAPAWLSEVYQEGTVSTVSSSSSGSKNALVFIKIKDPKDVANAEAITASLLEPIATKLKEQNRVMEDTKTIIRAIDRC